MGMPTLQKGSAAPMGPAQRRLRSGKPFWLKEPGTVRHEHPQLRGPRTTEVVIVGGGMTGALVAHAFADAGIRCVLLESETVGTGSTAASSALLLKEPDLELTALADRYGARAARRIWQLSQESVDGLVSLLRRLGVDCGLRLSDAVYYAVGKGSARRLREEYAYRRRAGFEATWLDPAAVRRAVGVPAHGAVRTAGNARFDPYRACVGVIRGAAAAGAEIYEQSRVTRIVTDDDRVRVWTSRGRVDAERVIIATGYATAAFRPLLGRFKMFRTYALVTERLSPATRRALGLADVMLWDTLRPYHYARWISDHRLLFGGADRPVQAAGRKDRERLAATAELLAYFLALLPGLSDVKIALTWEGLFATTPDTLPYIGPHQRYPRHWFALGYGGNGMTFGYLAARLLLARWQGQMAADRALFEFGRFRRPRHAHLRFA
jgi:glycine/D-amino acid oxidase-like deaminating enzyme